MALRSPALAASSNATHELPVGLGEQVWAASAQSSFGNTLHSSSATKQAPKPPESWRPRQLPSAHWGASVLLGRHTALHVPEVSPAFSTRHKKPAAHGVWPSQVSP